MKTRSIGLALVPLLGCVANLAGQTLTTEQVARQAIPATVTILVMDAKGDTISQGSGFLVTSEGAVVTNWHVLRGGESAVVILASGESFDRVRFLDGDSIADVAIIKIPGFGLPTLMPETEPVNVGSSVIVIGSPLGLSQTVTQGIVSAVRAHEGRSIIQMTAPISSGSSGGPVLNASGRVIGVTRSTIREGQQLNFAVPIRYALGLLADDPEPRPLAAIFGKATSRDEARQVIPDARSVAARFRQSLTGMYRIAAAIYLSGVVGVGDPVLEEGYLLIAGENDGWFMLDLPAHPMVLPVYDVLTNARGDVLMKAGRIVLEGHQTDTGLFVSGVDSTAGVAIGLGAEFTSSALSDRMGLYDIEIRTTYYGRGGYRGDILDWWGSGAVVTAGDSVFISFTVENKSGGSTGVTMATVIDADGSFRWKADGKELDGRFSPGRVTARWIDKRDGGGRFEGQLIGRKR